MRGKAAFAWSRGGARPANIGYGVAGRQLPNSKLAPRLPPLPRLGPSAAAATAAAAAVAVVAAARGSRSHAHRVRSVGEGRGRSLPSTHKRWRQANGHVAVQLRAAKYHPYRPVQMW
eukprot:168815-Chlamydomonas_euryale.AAC.2